VVSVGQLAAVQLAPPPHAGETAVLLHRAVDRRRADGVRHRHGELPSSPRHRQHDRTVASVPNGVGERLLDHSVGRERHAGAERVRVAEHHDL
ncbi:hypothetical protein B7R60_07050, partial [Streptococcus pyogenes]